MGEFRKRLYTFLDEEDDDEVERDINSADEMKKAKFKALVEKVYPKETVDEETIEIARFAGVSAILDTGLNMKLLNYSGLDSFFPIFERDKMNDFSKIIEQKSFKLKISEVDNTNCTTIKNFNESIRSIKKKYDSEPGYRSYMKIYVFSLLFALAVDKTDYEERLSMICDLAVILEVTEDEIYDMTQVVRFLYRDIKKADVQFRTETCENLFSYLLK